VLVSQQLGPGPAHPEQSLSVAHVLVVPSAHALALPELLPVPDDDVAPEEEAPEEEDVSTPDEEAVPEDDPLYPELPPLPLPLLDERPVLASFPPKLLAPGSAVEPPQAAARHVTPKETTSAVSETAFMSETSFPVKRVGRPALSVYPVPIVSVARILRTPIRCEARMRHASRPCR
jgi:hypothetical protein